MNGQSLKNTMNNFFIFGDSYSAEEQLEYKFSNEDFSYCWPKKLKSNFENEYNFKNFSLEGTGPYYSLKLFDEISNKLKKDDIVIFVISDLYRFMYSNLPSKFDMYSNNIMCDMNDLKPYYIGSSSNTSDQMKQRFLSFYEMHKENIEFFYDMFFKNLKPSSLFLMFSSMFKTIAENKKLLKFILLFKRTSYNKNYISHNVNNSKHFFSFFTELDRISSDEYIDNHRMFRGHDKRPNHLSIENHEIMFENILSIIDNFNEINYALKPFKKNILKESKNYQNFIYE